jgi:hypothetical protein
MKRIKVELKIRFHSEGKSMSNIETLSETKPFAFIVALDPNGWALMKRDLDLIKKVLLAVQARTDLAPRPVSVEGYDEVIVARHVQMLFKTGFLEGAEKQSGRSYAPIVMVTDLSWSGHEFLAALENENIWAKIKNSFSSDELAKMPLEALKAAAIGLATMLAKHRLGL